MTTEQTVARIREIDAERKELYRKDGTYFDHRGNHKTGFAIGDGQIATNKSEAMGYVKSRYAALMRERERLARTLA